MMDDTKNTKEPDIPKNNASADSHPFVSPIEETYNRKYKDTLFTSLFKNILAVLTEHRTA